MFVLFQSVQYEYMFGDDLLVAPVLSPGVESWTVYLPRPETWVSLWSAYEVEGGRHVDIEAPLGKPPVFYRKASAWKDLFEEIRKNFNF